MSESSVSPLIITVVDAGGSRTSVTVATDGPHTIGREPGSTAHVTDLRVSRRHAVVYREDGQWHLRIDAAAGAFVDGVPIDHLAVDEPTVVRLADARSGPTLELNPAGTPSSRTVRIGRAPDNDVVVQGLGVSRNHAKVVALDNGWELVDLSTPNGTFVNGTRVESATLKDGDRVTVGGSDHYFKAGRLIPSTSGDRLEARGVGYTLRSGKTLLSTIDLDLKPGTLMAVIGPSGSGKSTLAKVLTGSVKPTAGTVTYAGLDSFTDSAALRQRVGFVPQDDIVHRHLSAREALSFAAELRLAGSASTEDGQLRVAQVSAELGLTGHLDTRVSQLSGGQRKRVSTALELITEPSLLVLDEPTSGLDPDLDDQIMVALRTIADSGRIVIVITHTPASLHLCDEVLLLAPGGLPAFRGTAAKLLATFQASSWSTVFRKVSGDPAASHQRYVDAHNITGPVEQRSVTTRRAAGAPAGTADAAVTRKQTLTLARRHLRLLWADRGYSAFLGLVPVVLALLALVVPGGQGLSLPSIGSPSEPSQLLVILITGAVFMGAAASSREVVGERVIAVRELSSGLSATAYTAAKMLVFAAICAVQAAILVVTFSLFLSLPDGGMLLGTSLGAGLELTAAIGATAFASCMVSLWLSAVIRSSEQVMPILVVMVMGQLVLSGGLFSVTDRAGLAALAALAPSRWGYAASAISMDLRDLVPHGPQDPLWTASVGNWLLAMIVLVIMAAAFGALARRQVGRLTGP